MKARTFNCRNITGQASASCWCLLPGTRHTGGGQRQTGPTLICQRQQIRTVQLRPEWWRDGPLPRDTEGTVDGTCGLRASQRIRHRDVDAKAVGPGAEVAVRSLPGGGIDARSRGGSLVVS